MRVEQFFEIIFLLEFKFNMVHCNGIFNPLYIQKKNNRSKEILHPEWQIPFLYWHVPWNKTNMQAAAARTPPAPAPCRDFPRRAARPSPSLQGPPVWTTLSPGGSQIWVWSCFKYQSLKTFKLSLTLPQKGCISSSQLVLFLKCLDRLAKGPVNYLLLLIGLVHLSGGLGPLSLIDKWSIKGCVGSKLFD